MTRLLRIVFFALALAFLAWTFLNASWLAPAPVGRSGLIAHRASAPGIGSCETAPGAARYPVLPDNSLRAIGDARQLGATVIAVEVAADGTIAPARCANSFGSRPTLEEILAVAKPKALMFSFAGTDPVAADRLFAALKAEGRDPVAAHDAFYAPGEAGPIARMRTLLPKAWVFSAQSATACREAYRKTGWTTFLPAECKGGTMMIPLDAQGSLAGWPNRLLARMSGGGGHVIIVAPGNVGGDPKGLDQPQQFGEIPASFNGLIWIDDLWNLGPALYPRTDNRSRAEQDAGEAGQKARLVAQTP
jgi:glycerophosphoryl diester phosphodiesterase